MGSRGSSEMDKQFHLTFYWLYDYLSMLGLKLIPISKRDGVILKDIEMNDWCETTGVKRQQNAPINKPCA